MDGKLRNMATVYITRGDEILLLYRQGGRVVSDVYTGSAGGHFEKDELNDARACALRELYEELGLTGDDLIGLRHRYITLRHVKGEIRQNYYFFAELRPGVSGDVTSTEGKARWFKLGDTDRLEMPVSARQMLNHYIETGRFDDNVYVCVASPGGAVITPLKID